MNEEKQKYDPWFPLVRIAESLEEILRLVKADQEKMEKAKLREPDDIKGGW